MLTETQLLRLAYCRRLLEAAHKSKTPGGAKKLYEQYLRTLVNPSKSKKRPADFFDRERGADPQTSEKHKTKSEKGTEKTKTKQEKEKAKIPDQSGYDFLTNHEWKMVSQFKKQINEARTKAKDEASHMSPSHLKKKVDAILQAENLSLEEALTELRVTDSTLRSMGTAWYNADIDSKVDDTYNHTLLNQYKKSLKDKDERANAGNIQRKRTLKDMSKKHGLEEEDLDALREFTKKKKKPGEEPSRKRTPSQVKADFLKHADPETKKRVEKMTPAEFQAMFAAIMEDEEVGGGKEASARSALIRLASSLPPGNTDRRILLAYLRS